MKCRRVRTLLPDYTGDELSAEQRRQIDGHLKGCPNCRDDLMRLQAVWDGFAQQPLPQKEKGFWQEFTREVMAATRKQGLIPPTRKREFLFPGWRFLIPAAAMAALIIVSVIFLRGGLRGSLMPEVRSPWATPLSEQETIGEAAHTLSVAPLAMDEEGPLDKGIGLQGLPLSAQVLGIPLKSKDMTTITEVLTQRFGEEDIYGKLEELTGEEQEEFYQLLSSQYPHT
jgi:hypothetical protein